MSTEPDWLNADPEFVLTYVDGHVERIPFGPKGISSGVDRHGHVLRLEGESADGHRWTKSIPTMNLRAWWTEFLGEVR